jgi:hypothetical protein
MTEPMPPDKRIRKNIMLLESVIAKAEELVIARNMGDYKFSQLLADLIQEEHRRRGSDEGKSIWELLTRIGKLEKEIEEWKGKHRSALQFAGEYDYQATEAWRRVKELEREIHEHKLEDLRLADKNSIQARTLKAKWQAT